MSEKRRERVSRYDLVTSEDTYASQTAQNPVTSRRLLAMVPQPDATLVRQNAHTRFYTTQGTTSRSVVWMIPFIFNNSGTFVRHLFVKYAGNPTLFEFTGTAWRQLPYQFQSNPGTDYILHAELNNALHYTDGATNFMYDGGGDLVVQDGLPVNQITPGETVSSSAGTLSVLTNRFYWTSFADMTTTRPHESSAGPISLGTGPFTSKFVTVNQSQGTITVNANSTVVQGSNTKFTEILPMLGFEKDGTPLKGFPAVENFRPIIALLGGQTAFIAGITSDVNMTLASPLSTTTTFTNKPFTVAPQRATAWNIYASESENSQVGFLLVSVDLPYARPGSITLSHADFGGYDILGTGTNFTSADIGKPLHGPGEVFIGNIAFYFSATHVALDPLTIGTFTNGQVYNFYTTGQVLYTDQSPFLGTAGSLFSQIQRPVRNDPAPACNVIAQHKYRLWRNRVARPNFFNFTANEEVLAFSNGSPYESVPGADELTVSDIVNEASYPDQSKEIRGAISHADALYIFTNLQALPLYGETVDDFALSQVTGFNVGSAGSRALVSTPHGLAFMSNDRKVYLYPTSNYPWAYVPKDVNVTDQLIEIGLPLRNQFKNISTANLANVQLTFYNFMTRDWLIVSYTSVVGNIRNYVYDFATKGWFELIASTNGAGSPGYTNFTVFEFSEGNKVLLAGGLDGFIYVVDDQTNTYIPTDLIPQGQWRPALIDFGDPDSKHVFRYLEFELTNPKMIGDLAVTYWLDPDSADTPTTSSSMLNMQAVRGSGGNTGGTKSQLFRGFPTKGGLCQRMLVSFDFAPSANSGGFRGVKLVADKASSLIR